MGWIISVGRVKQVSKQLSKQSITGFGSAVNAVVITSHSVSHPITTTPCHVLAHMSTTPNADKTTLGHAGSNPARKTEQVWRNVLSILVGD
jgi:uncharacterized protein (DUF697 family)